MSMSQEQILNQLTDPREAAAFKSMYSDMVNGKGMLNPEKLGQFLREATLPNTILRDARLDIMQSTEKELNRTSINGRVLQQGYTSGVGTTNESLTAADVDFGANVLKAVKLKALCEISDDEKEDNLEQAQFENTLLSMMGERVGEDLEAWALFGDTTKTSNDLFKSNDGWIKKANNKVVDGTDCDVDANTIEALFDTMIKAVPPRHRDRNKLKFYVPFEVEDAYRNLLKARGTILGDDTQIGFGGIKYKNIPIEHCTTLDAADCRALDNTGKVILTDPNNLVYGIWKNITIEPNRVAKSELTQYFFRLRADVNFQYTNATVVGSISKDTLEGLPEASKS